MDLGRPDSLLVGYCYPFFQAVIRHCEPRVSRDSQRTRRSDATFRDDAGQPPHTRPDVAKVRGEPHFNWLAKRSTAPVSYTHLTLPTTPYV